MSRVEDVTLHSHEKAAEAPKTPSHRFRFALSGRDSPTDLYPRMAIFRDFGCGMSRAGYRI